MTNQGAKKPTQPNDLSSRRIYPIDLHTTFREGAEMPSERTLSVNGAKHVVSAPPDTPLLYVLRNELKLTGPRLGCGMAQCGACAVLLDGEEARACVTPLSYAVGKQITTIEGLPAVWAEQKGLNAADAAKTLHPVQQAWIDEQVPQCGYCQKRHDDRRGAVARQESKSNSGSNQGRLHQYAAVTSPLPLRHLHRHHRRRATRRPGHEIVKQE
jgi:aerobic-type carbon monoxide dehydrogenase small subunit (CoxS/CutS family)